MMHIGNISNRNNQSDFATNLRFTQTNAQKVKSNEEEDESKKKSGSFKALELTRKEEEFSMAAMLQKQKESLQKRLGAYSEKLAAIEKQKNEVPFEIKEVLVDGKAVQVRSYTEDNQKTIDSLNGQADTMMADIKAANEELLALDKKIRQTMIEEEKQKAEKMNKEREEEQKKKAEKKDEQLTEEEKKQKAERAQVEFFAQSDSVKKYINDSRITQAKMKAEKTFNEISMAKDAQRAAETEARAAHSANGAEVEAREAKHLRETGEEIDLPNLVPKTTDSVISEQVARVRAGSYSPSEAGSVDAKEIADLQDGIDGIENSINENIGKINKEAKEVREEEEDDRKTKDKEEEDGEGLSVSVDEGEEEKSETPSIE